MLDGFLIGYAAVFQHILDQIDSAAGAIQFVSKDLVGRAGRGTKSAVHASAEYFVGPLDAWIFELFCGEIRLHG